MKIITSLCLAFLCAVCVRSEAHQFTVVDQEGQPVAFAVLSVAIAPAAAQSTQPAIMDQVDKQFAPHVLVIRAGQLVSFPNSDNIRHHVYSFSAPNSFELKLYKGKEAPPVQFSSPGIVVLGCNIHDSMLGYIYVQGQETAALTDANGVVNLPDAADLQLSIWHPRQNLPLAERSVIQLTPGQTRITLPFSLQPASEQETSGFKHNKLAGQTAS